MNVDVILGRKGRQVHTVPASTTVQDALQRMAETGVSALVVSDDGAHVDGIISDRDMIRLMAASGGSGLHGTVAEAMTSEVITCQPDDRVVSLMNIMTRERIRHIPVTEGDDRHLVGMISIGDVVKNRLDEIELEADSLRDYITRTH